MVTVIAILMILVCFNFVLKQTFNSWRATAVTVGVLAVFVALTWPLAIRQSQTRIAEWLASQPLMQNIAVILSIDVVLLLLFCLFTLRSDAGLPQKLRRRVANALLAYYPGFAIFPVAFAVLVELVFSLPGTSFSLIGYSFAAGIAAFVPLCVYLLRTLFAEKSLRLEVLFLSNLLVALIGVIATVNVSAQQSPDDGIDWQASLFVLLLLAIGVAAGVLLRYLRLRRGKP